MKTQSQTTSKGQLLLVLAGIFAIPLYAVYFNETPEEKLDKLKKQKPAAVALKAVKLEEDKNKLTPQPKSVNIDDMSFDQAFHYYRKIQGEGSVFTWNGYEYIIAVSEPVIPPSKYDGLDFGDAFKQARIDLGHSNQFEWRGSVYSTSIVGEKEKTATQAVKTNLEKNKQEEVQMSASEKDSAVQKHFLYGLNDADHYHRNFSGLSACYVPTELCSYDHK